MKHAIIDLGSNSMRMTLYEIKDGAFKILFKEKIMAGLAGYLANGNLTPEGIARACSGLLEFKGILQSLSIDRVSVFATASLRNIKNTKQAVDDIFAATGFHVEVISGREEALCGYIGAVQPLHIAQGAFVDIGGGSTEVVYFNSDGPVTADSFPVGSLNMYKRCVKKIFPSEKAIAAMRKAIGEEIDKERLPKLGKTRQFVCAGGTSRAVLKIARKLFDLPIGCQTVAAKQLEEIVKLLCKADRAAADLILKLEPDRIHTMIPGILILQHMVQHMDAKEILVSQNGVREGYLCQRVLSQASTAICIPKTGN